MVFLFKGIAPPSQFPATVASGAPPRPNHAFFQDGVDVRFEPLGGAGGGRGLSPQRAHNVFLKKEFSLHTKCPQREYVLCMHIASPTYLPYVPLVNHMLYSALHLRYAWRGVPQLPKRGGLLVSTVLPEATKNTMSPCLAPCMCCSMQSLCSVGTPPLRSIEHLLLAPQVPFPAVNTP